MFAWPHHEHGLQICSKHICSNVCTQAKEEEVAEYCRCQLAARKQQQAGLEAKQLENDITGHEVGQTLCRTTASIKQSWWMCMQRSATHVVSLANGILQTVHLQVFSQGAVHSILFRMALAFCINSSTSHVLHVGCNACKSF